MYVYKPLDYSKLAYISILMTVWIFPLILSGCGKDTVKVYDPIDYFDGDGYVAFTAEGAIPGFSFEYPSDYILYSYQCMPEYRSISVMLSDIDYHYHEEIIDGQLIITNMIEYPSESEWDYRNIDIYVHRANEYESEAETRVDRVINDYEWFESAGYIADFKILERNRVMVSGMEGWEIVVSYTDLPVTPSGFYYGRTRTRAVLVIVRDLFFDYQDTVWKISVFSDAGNADQAKLDYEHILGTLRILD